MTECWPRNENQPIYGEWHVCIGILLTTRIHYESETLSITLQSAWSFKYTQRFYPWIDSVNSKHVQDFVKWSHTIRSDIQTGKWNEWRKLAIKLINKLIDRKHIVFQNVRTQLKQTFWRSVRWERSSDHFHYGDLSSKTYSRMKF